MKAQKLTLLVPSDAVKRAKRFARQSGRSLSSIVAETFMQLPQDAGEQAVAPVTELLTGVIDLAGQSEDELLLDALLDKYGRPR